MMRQTIWLDLAKGADGSNSITCDDKELMDIVIEALADFGADYNHETGAWTFPVTD